MHISRMTLLPLVLAAVGAVSAGAQQKECTIDEGNPSNVARAMLQLQMAAQAKAPADAEKQLSQAVKLISESDPNKNPIGRSFVLGKVLTVWFSQPDITPVMNRGKLGFTTNPEGTMDLVTAIDSAFTVVEQSNPACTKETYPWRGQKGWVNLVNAAVEAVNNDQADSAAALAQRSLILYKGAPYAYMVLGNVAQKKNNTADALKYFRQTVDAAKDTVYADVRRQTLLNMGNMASDAAETATGADKTTYTNTARDAFNELLKDPGKPAMADAARQGLSKLLLASGDTTAFKAMYKEQLDNPSAFDYQQLMNAGVNAARAEQVKDAIVLFKSAYAKNAYHRDVLYNLAIMYIKSNQDSLAIPLIRKLVEVDPSNGENYRLFTFAYADEQKALSAAGKTWTDKNKAAVEAYDKLSAAAKKKGGAAVLAPAKLAADSANYYNAIAKTVTDSALKYNEMADKLPVKVSFTEFTPKDNSTTLSGTIMNNSETAQSYTIKVDFLDKDGKVVATQQQSVGPVQPKAQGRFSVVGQGATIVAFRYAPLTS